MVKSSRVAFIFRCNQLIPVEQPHSTLPSSIFSGFKRGRRIITVNRKMMLLVKLASLICNSIIGLKSRQIRVVKNAASPSSMVTVCNVLKSIKEGLSSSSPYEAGNDDNDGECSCCICLSQMEIDESELKMLPCEHKFHKVCIERWLKRCRRRRRSCPLCCFSMVEDDDAKSDEEEEEEQYLSEEMLIWFSCPKK